MKKVTPTDKIFIPKHTIEPKHEYCEYDKLYSSKLNVYPIKNFWSNFDKNGRQKWFIELSNGRLISDRDENYFYWLKKYTDKK